MLNEIIKSKIEENNIQSKKEEIREMLDSLGLTSDNDDTYKLTTLPDYLYFRVVLEGLEVNASLDFKDGNNWFYGSDSDIFYNQFIVDIDIKDLQSTLVDQFTELINDHCKD